MIIRRLLLSLVAIGVIAFISIPWWIPLFIYRPASLPDASPARWGVAAEQVAFASGGGRVVGWWRAPTRSGGDVVLIAHGRSANIATRAGIVRTLTSAGYGVLMFDYRGYGASSGRASEKGLTVDTLAAYGWLRRSGVAPRRLIVLGQSLGDAPAAYLAAHRPVAALVLVSPFTSLPDTAADRAGWLPWRLLAWPRNRFDVAGQIGHVTAPILLIASANDGIVPLSTSRRLARLAARPQWLRVDHLHHDGLLAGVAADGRLVGALDRLIGSRSPAVARFTPPLTR